MAGQNVVGMRLSEDGVRRTAQVEYNREGAKVAAWESVRNVAIVVRGV